MSEFIYQGFTKGALELINQCRIYHQVVTVADIALADGTEFGPVYKGATRHRDRVSPLQWPTQNCPSPKVWEQWNRALTFLLYKGKLRTALGVWKTRPHQKWAWVVRLTDMVLFHCGSQGWEKFYPAVPNLSRSTRSSHKPWYFKDESTQSNPPEGEVAAASPIFNDLDGGLFTIRWSTKIPAIRQGSILHSGSTSEESRSSSKAETIILPSLVPSFNEGLKHSAYFDRLVGPVQAPTEADLLEIIACISSETLLVCSDGSFYPHKGTGSHA